MSPAQMANRASTLDAIRKAIILAANAAGLKRPIQASSEARAPRDLSEMAKVGPVCIAGMHRSGTSMVTNLLHHCGLYLGPARKLLPASSGNSLGYWENREFVSLNDEILHRFGGSWDEPPTSMSDLSPDRKFLRLIARAKRLVQEFEGNGSWGWKDPRNSLTLPFWTKLVPGLKVVICIRHPYEVDLSLRARVNGAHLDGLGLWRVYNQRIIEDTSPGQRLVTHYDAHFRDPQGELRRILDFIGVPREWEPPEACHELIRSDLRHHDRHGAPLLEQDTGPRLRSLYERMCAEARS